MFTGLIVDLGSVVSIRRDGGGATLRVASALVDELGEGDSIAVNGVCLTVTALVSGCFEAQAMNETLTRSTLGGLAESDAVNLEPPMALGGRLGGHMVQGHVDATGTVVDAREDGFARVLEIAHEPRLGRYMVEKGSVAVDGVSLTLSRVGDGRFEVSLIPETLERTTLGRIGIGDRVNLEVDILAKHVERLLEGVAGGRGAAGKERRDEPT